MIDEYYERRTKMVINDIDPEVLLSQELVVKVGDEEGKVKVNGRIRIPLCLEKKRRYLGNVGVELELRIPLLAEETVEVRRPVDSGGYGRVYTTDKVWLAKLPMKPIKSLAKAYEDESFRNELVAGAILPFLFFLFAPKLRFKLKEEIGLLMINGNMHANCGGRLVSGRQANTGIGCLVLNIRLLHLFGLMHRDVKPDNLFPISSNSPINESAIGHLLDFGCMTVDDDEKNFAGTIRYMAPELSSGNGYDWRADLYSAGICLVEYHEDYSRRLERIKKRVAPRFVYDALIKECCFNNILLLLLEEDPAVREIGMKYTVLGYDMLFGNMFPQLTYVEATTSEVIDQFASHKRANEFALDRERACFANKPSREDTVNQMNQEALMDSSDKVIFPEWSRVLQTHPLVEAKFICSMIGKNPKKELMHWLSLCFTDSPSLQKKFTLLATGFWYLHYFEIVEDFEDLFFGYIQYLHDDLLLSYEARKYRTMLSLFNDLRGSKLHPQIRRIYPHLELEFQHHKFQFFL